MDLNMTEADKQKEVSENIQKDIREGLEKFIFEPVVNDGKIKEVITDILNKYYESGDIVDHNIQQPDNVKVDLMWRTFSWKQKLKWYFYDKFLKKNKKEIIDIVDNYNSLVFKLNNKLLAELDEDDEDGSYVPKSTMDYPYYVQPNPKQIIVSDIRIKPNQTLSYVRLDLTIDKDGNIVND